MKQNNSQELLNLLPKHIVQNKCPQKHNEQTIQLRLPFLFMFVYMFPNNFGPSNLVFPDSLTRAYGLGWGWGARTPKSLARGFVKRIKRSSYERAWTYMGKHDCSSGLLGEDYDDFRFICLVRLCFYFSGLYGLNYSEMANLGFRNGLQYFSFGNFQTFDQISTLGPLIYYRHT